LTGKLFGDTLPVLPLGTQLYEYNCDCNANNANLQYTVYIVLYTVSHNYQKYYIRCIETLYTYTFYLNL